MAKSSLIVISTSASHKEKLKKDLEDSFDLTFLSTGAAALRALQKKLPKAIILDNSLEDFLTFKFIDKVRNNPVTRSLPFIIVSRESSHSFLEQGVRSGVAHYIGIPYESKVFVEKIKIALRPGEIIPRESYFHLPVAIDTHVISYGRVSFVSEAGIHFETHLKLEPGVQIKFRSPLSEALGEQCLEVRVTQVGTDVFYNYPFAIDAEWTNPEIAKRVSAWIRDNRNLNSPKKSKVLFISSDLKFESKIVELIDQSKYSPRFQFTLEDGVNALPYMKPAGVVMDIKSWEDASGGMKSRFLKSYLGPWIVFGDGDHSKLQAFSAPNDPDSVVLAVQQQLPPKPIEADRLYFSKSLEDSRLKILFDGRVLVLGELGVNIAFEHDVIAPCNFQLDLKSLPGEDVRNPYIRVWPPSRRLGGAESANGKFKAAFDSHFLGINDQQGQALRQWLRDEELKDRKKGIANIPPKPKE